MQLVRTISTSSATSTAPVSKGHRSSVKDSGLSVIPQLKADVSVLVKASYYSVNQNLVLVFRQAVGFPLRPEMSNSLLRSETAESAARPEA